MTTGTLGNSGSRWCLKGVSRSTRRGGGSGNGGGRNPNPDANSTNSTWESGEAREAAGREEEGETMIEMAEEPRFALISSCPSSDVPGVAAEQPRPEAGGLAAGGADGPEADELSLLLSSSSSPPASLQQPLEEVNPSVLNTKANGNRNCSGSGSSNSARGRGDNSGDSSGDGVSAGGVRSRGVGVGGGVGTGKEGGDPAEGVGLAAAVVGDDGRAEDGGRGSVAGVEDSTAAAAAAAAPDADAEDFAAENSTADQRRVGVFSDGRRNATESCSEVPECMVDRRGAVIDGGRSAEPKDTDAGGGGGLGSQLGCSAVCAPAADDGVGVAALRARGKSMDTEEDSTGMISPVQKRNRRELKVWDGCVDFVCMHISSHVRYCVSV